MTETDNNDRLRQLEEENERLKAENQELKRRLLQAKDPNPVERVSFRRVVKLAQSACLSVVREGGKFLVRLGDKVRTFKCLREIWDFLTQDDWSLSDLFSQESQKPKRQKGCCKYCDRPIKWYKEFNALTWAFENFTPLNHDGSVHRCSKRGY